MTWAAAAAVINKPLFKGTSVFNGLLNLSEPVGDNESDDNGDVGLCNVISVWKSALNKFDAYGVCDSFDVPVNWDGWICGGIPVGFLCGIGYGA